MRWSNRPRRPSVTGALLFPRRPNAATATLTTWWGANATGTGKGACTAQLSAAPWIGGTKGLIAVFGCGPIDMSWGGRVTVTGTVSAK